MQALILVMLALLGTHVLTSAQSVIINEISQGSDGGKEWVELLIIDEGVDLRAWELGDNDDGTWHSIAEFSSHSSLNNIASGTIIVIFNSGDTDGTIIAAGGEDTTFNDKSLILGIDNSSFLTDTGPWGGSAGAFANSDGDDGPAIRNASDEIIHDMAVTHPSATISSPAVGKVKYYTGNTVGGVIDDSKWLVANSGSGTPGVANGGDNSDWVDQSLPVELTEWLASNLAGSVQLQWATESEYENQGFIIERAIMPAQGPNSEFVEAWREIASFVSSSKLLGQGSTTSKNLYTFTDRDVRVGETYLYRLSDVDYKGTVTTHKVISVMVYDDARNQTYRINTYPNPSNSGIHIVIEFGNELRPLRVNILNLKGELVKHLFSGTPEIGSLDILWNGSDMNEIAVPSGIYFASISGPNLSQSRTITIIQ